MLKISLRRAIVACLLACVSAVGFAQEEDCDSIDGDFEVVVVKKGSRKPGQQPETITVEKAMDALLTNDLEQCARLMKDAGYPCAVDSLKSSHFLFVLARRMSDVRGMENGAYYVTRAAAELGNIDAIYTMAEWNDMGYLRCPIDGGWCGTGDHVGTITGLSQAEGNKWLIKGADLGDDEMTFRVGMAYYNGWWGNRESIDRKKALPYLLKSAALSENSMPARSGVISLPIEDAKIALAEMYLNIFGNDTIFHGSGKKKSKALERQGIEYLQKTVHDLHSKALLAKCYYEGIGVRKNHKKAFALFRDAYKTLRDDKFYYYHEGTAYIICHGISLCYDNPVMMDSVAKEVFICDVVLGEKLYGELKKAYPNYVDAYYSLASLYYALGLHEDPDCDSICVEKSMLDKAKAQLDSAKVLVPNSPEPYMRWIRMIGKYYPESVYSEIDTLKMRIHGYSGYLSAAKFFYGQSQADDYKFLLLDARRCFSKAERDSMSLTDYQHYANVCYRIASIQKQRADYEKCISVAEEGLEIFQNDTDLLRMKLYSYCGLTSVASIRSKDGTSIKQLNSEEVKDRWDSAYHVAKVMASLPDTISYNATDYKWMASAYLETGHYAEALNLFEKQVWSDSKDSVECASALGNIVDCYKGMKRYEEAISAFNQFNAYKTMNGMSLDIYDYQKLATVYYRLGADTLLEYHNQLAYIEKSDSIYAMMSGLSQKHVGSVNYHRLSLALFLVKLEGSEFAFSRMLEASNRLVKSMIAIKEEDRKATDWYFMIRGMRYAMEYYLFTDKWAETWVCADEIMSLPDATELQGLSDTSIKDYNQCRERATLILEKMHFMAERGKELKESWHPFE